MKKNTIALAEQALYGVIFDLSLQHPACHAWLQALPNWLHAIKDKNRYANAPYYASLVDKLPKVVSQGYELNRAEIAAYVSWGSDERKKTQALLKALSPWRKGGFRLGVGANELHIDAEWRSDLKWDRIIPFLSLTDKTVLDVGGGCGYHGFRMVGAGAKLVMVLDPSPLFYYQFMAIRHFLPNLENKNGQFPVHFLPITLDELPSSGAFDVVFCMGVLYHRPSPFDCLSQLKAQIKPGGVLVLETLVVAGDETTVLVPKGRYAMMNNVYFLPSVAALSLWLEKAGFSEVVCVDVSTTTTSEQRQTPYMTYQSLSDFLDPMDNSKTKEGYPRPVRAVMTAKKY